MGLKSKPETTGFLVYKVFASTYHDEQKRYDVAVCGTLAAVEELVEVHVTDEVGTKQKLSWSCLPDSRQVWTATGGSYFWFAKPIEII